MDPGPSKHCFCACAARLALVPRRFARKWDSRKTGGPWERDICKENSKTEYYPNPTRAGNIIQINSSANNSKISITSIKGQEIFSTTTKEKAVQIPANLPNGIYLIQVNGQSPNTLIIQND